MAKEFILTVWLNDDANSAIISDAINELLRTPDIYNLIDDTDDEGWFYYG